MFVAIFRRKAPICSALAPASSGAAAAASRTAPSISSGVASGRGVALPAKVREKEDAPVVLIAVALAGVTTVNLFNPSFSAKPGLRASMVIIVQTTAPRRRAQDTTLPRARLLFIYSAALSLSFLAASKAAPGINAAAASAAPSATTPTTAAPSSAFSPTLSEDHHEDERLPPFPHR